MKCVVIFALLAVWISSSDAATCEKFELCDPDRDTLIKTLSEDIQKYCNLVKYGMNCTTSALADCRKNVTFNKYTIERLQTKKQGYSSILDSMCSGSNGNSALKVSALILALVLAVFNFIL